MNARLDCTAVEPNRHAGFTLLEVLVTLFVIAVALLGTAGLQAYAMKTSQSGQLRTQAVILGLDMLERIEANNDDAKLPVSAYVADPLPDAFPTDCMATLCTPADLAVFDLVQFKTKLEDALPNATATIARTGAGPWTYTLQINWEERITQGAKTTAATSGTTTVGASGATERFSYTLSRTIYDRSIMI